MGDLTKSCKRIALMPGAWGPQMHLQFIKMGKPDVIIIGEAQEWETIEYIRDAQTYRDWGGRQELADVEKSELAVIESFLPAQMSENEVKAAIAAIIAETGAEGMKDMGKVVGALKAKHGSQLDMGKASGLVKAALVS